MSRTLPAEITTATTADTIIVFWAVDLLFDSPNDLYFWNGVGDLSYDGNTYVSAGELLNLSDIRESSDIAAYGATLTLSGIPSNLISLAQSEPYQGRRCLVRFGIKDPMDTIVMTTVFEGEMDQMNFSIGPETATITLAVESRLVDLRRPRIRRYSDADQQSRFAGDLAFEFLPRLQNESLEWTG